eukprot:TRINITY_DN12390_c0_g1_i1.p1 TRINITY_DN12390_c0_g1~~TRINITY_DN12390_c0_g1_i1.p1  ORF type:complete len:295 (+),score=23.63 TRINITY_DN12390_c0_g1_i1:551-1435(+)
MHPDSHPRRFLIKFKKWETQQESILQIGVPHACFLIFASQKTKKIFKSMEQFYSDAHAGTLPNYSFIAPRMYPTKDVPANDQHPDHDVLEGELLIKDVYESLRNGPLWNKTLYIILYDEHGGFYDHVPTTLNVPNPDGRISTDPLFFFNRIGIRVPMIAISPWVNKGTLVHEPTERSFPNSQFEHSSVPATMKKLFGWKDFLTKRDAWASSFNFVYSQRSTPRTDCPTSLPFIPPTSRRQQALSESNRPMNGLQREHFAYQGCNLPPMSASQLDKLTQFEAGQLLRKAHKAMFE